MRSTERGFADGFNSDNLLLLSETWWLMEDDDWWLHLKYISSSISTKCFLIKNTAFFQLVKKIHALYQSHLLCISLIITYQNNWLGGAWHLFLFLQQIKISIYPTYFQWANSLCLLQFSSIKPRPLVTIPQCSFPQWSGLAGWTSSSLPHVGTYCQKLHKLKNSCYHAPQAWAHLWDLRLNNSKPGGAWVCHTD